MKVIWTIKYGAEEKTASSWGVNSLHCLTRVKDTDEFTFFRPCKHGDAEPLFAVGSTLQLFRTEGETRVKWFEGVVVDDNCQISGRSEGQGYQVLGGLYYLQNHIFKQIWKSYTGDKDNLTEVRLSRVMLGTKVVINSLQRQHMRDQIAEVMDYARLCGVPLDYDVSAVPQIFLPTDELVDRSCDEAIERQLYYVPDLVTTVDYSPATPKLWMRKRDAINPVSLPAVGSLVDQLSIKECYELRRPSVVLRYEMTNSVDGTVWMEHAIDKVPADATGDELRAFMQTINLQGFARTTSNASLLADAILPDDVLWWKAHLDWLNDAEIDRIVLGESKRSGELGLANELKDGSFPPWLILQGYSYELETIQVSAKITFKNGTIREDVLSVNVNATDAPSGDYTNIDSQTDPEPIPVGLAQELYNAVNRREFKGSFKIVEQECSRRVTAGSVFNLTGGRAIWSNMNALVNQVDEDIDNGITSVSFGPPAYLGLDQFLELMRVNRTRQIFTFSTNRRATGKFGLDNRIELPKTVGKRDSQNGTKGHERLVVKTTVSQNRTGSIDLNAAATVVDGVERPMAPTILPFCQKNEDGSTSTRKVLVLASEVFD